MASNQTEHYGLNQWSAEDSFLRTEFNEDNRKADAAIKHCEVVVGTYMGTYETNAIGQSINPTQEIHLGFRPRALLVLPNRYNAGGRESYAFLGGLYVDNPLAGEIRFTDTGFIASYQLNYKDTPQSGSYPYNPYRYLAWR
ncbi:MAG: hypothetical protein EOM52_03555 [Clostridia bacterium]|nr:hypothetical protein [Clostridia bacterium]